MKFGKLSLANDWKVFIIYCYWLNRHRKNNNLFNHPNFYKSMIIDSHTHIDMYTEEKIPVSERIPNLKKIMKDSGITKSIILTDMEDGCLSMNEILFLIKDEKDILLAGTIKVTNHTDNDIAKLRELIKNKKIIAIKLYPGYEDFYPIDERCSKVYDLCEEFNIPVIFHSGDILGLGKGIKYSKPEHIDELAVKRPNLKIIIAHLGNPYTNDTLVILNRHKNVYSDISGLVPRTFDSYWKEHFQKEIIKILKWCSDENKLLFGTDWPFWDESMYFNLTKEYVKFVKSLDISEEDKEKIFYKNAEKVFNLD